MKTIKIILGVLVAFALPYLIGSFFIDCERPIDYLAAWALGTGLVAMIAVIVLGVVEIIEKIENL
jgi:polyferredoxin